jgi:hypothetical protein
MNERENRKKLGGKLKDIRGVGGRKTMNGRNKFIHHNFFQ